MAHTFTTEDLNPMHRYFKNAVVLLNLQSNCKYEALLLKKKKLFYLRLLKRLMFEKRVLGVNS